MKLKNPQIFINEYQELVLKQAQERIDLLEKHKTTENTQLKPCKTTKKLA